MEFYMSYFKLNSPYVPVLPRTDGQNTVLFWSVKNVAQGMLCWSRANMQCSGSEQPLSLSNFPAMKNYIDFINKYKITSVMGCKIYNNNLLMCYFDTCCYLDPTDMHFVKA